MLLTLIRLEMQHYPWSGTKRRVSRLRCVDKAGETQQNIHTVALKGKEKSRF